MTRRSSGCPLAMALTMSAMPLSSMTVLSLGTVRCWTASDRCPRIDVYSRADRVAGRVFSGPLPEIIVGMRFLRLDLDGAHEQLGQKPHGQRHFCVCPIVCY